MHASLSHKEKSRARILHGAVLAITVVDCVKYKTVILRWKVLVNRRVVIGEKVRDDAPITYACLEDSKITDFINVVASQSLKSVKFVVSGGSSMYTITLLSKGASRGRA